MPRAHIGRLLAALFAALTLLCLPVPGARAQPGDMARLLRIGELADALRVEGLQDGRALGAEMLGEEIPEGQGGDFWSAELDRIYDAERMTATLATALDSLVPADAAAATEAFFGSDLGQRILTLEISARVAMRDPDIEEAARAAARDQWARDDDSRAAMIDRFVAALDLVDRNVASALNSSLAFLHGMSDGGVIEASDAMLLAQVQADEPETRAYVQGWLSAYLLLSYAPLSDADLDSYLTFVESPAGHAVNQALFDSFEQLYQDISYTLGLRLAAAMTSSRL